MSGHSHANHNIRNSFQSCSIAIDKLLLLLLSRALGLLRLLLSSTSVLVLLLLCRARNLILLGLSLSSDFISLLLRFTTILLLEVLGGTGQIISLLSGEVLEVLCLLAAGCLQLLVLVGSLVLLRAENASNVLQTLGRDAELGAQDGFAEGDDTLTIATSGLAVFITVGVTGVADGEGGVGVEGVEVGVLEGRDVVVDVVESGIDEAVDFAGVWGDVGSGGCEIG